MQSPIVTTAERRPDGAFMAFLLLLDHVVIEPVATNHRSRIKACWRLLRFACYCQRSALRREYLAGAEARRNPPRGGRTATYRPVARSPRSTSARRALR